MGLGEVVHERRGAVDLPLDRTVGFANSGTDLRRKVTDREITVSSARPSLSDDKRANLVQRSGFQRLHLCDHLPT